jgi:hypothetical protein
VHDARGVQVRDAPEQARKHGARVALRVGAVGEHSVQQLAA